MMAARINFEERDFILKRYGMFQNAVEVQIPFRRMFQRDPATWFSKTLIKSKFESTRTVQNVQKINSGRNGLLKNATEKEKLFEIHPQNH